MKLLKSAIICLAAIGVWVQTAGAQCATVLTNMGPDGAGNVHAWAVMTDNYTNTSSGCAPSSWNTTGFTHTYGATVTITSPSGRKSTAAGNGSQRGGLGTGSIRDDDYLPIAGEIGTFLASGNETITCTIAGLFFTGIVTGAFKPPPPYISGVGDNTTGKNTIYVNTSGFLAVYGSALTAWGETMSPTVTGDDGSIALSRYWASDAQVNVQYTVGTSARTGQHSLWITTEAGQSNAGTYYVYDATPVITSISPSVWQAGASTPVTISGTGFGTTPTVSFSDSYVSWTQGSASDTSISGTATVNANDPGGTVTITVTSNGYGSGFQGGTGQAKQGSKTATVAPAKPQITSISPTIKMIGSNNAQLTISGQAFGMAPTVNLPAGFTSNSQGSTPTSIVVVVNIGLAANIGVNQISVTANGQTSNNVQFEVDGPYQMVVQSDIKGLCVGCSSTIERDTTYQVKNFSGTAAGAIQICEAPTFSGWSCTQPEGHSYTNCTAPVTISASGVFTDVWTMSSDAYTPAGCGFNNSNPWKWAASPTVQRELGLLQGYIHTNAISINGCVMPSCTMNFGTVIPK